jgi:hypothetical protein
VRPERRRLVEAPTLCDVGMVRRGGLASVDLSLTGYWTGELTDPLFYGHLGLADIPITVSPGAADSIEAGATGARAFLFRAVEGEYTFGGAIGDMHAARATAQSSAGDPLVRGTLLHNGTQSSGAAASTPLNLGAVASGKRLYAALHVLAVAGTLDVLVASDDAEAFGSPTARIVFTQASAVGSQWGTPVAGPITDTWWRASWTVAGGDATFVVAMGIE